MPEVITSRVKILPRLPLEGKIDLTYRCDNACRHCWSRLPPQAREGREELSFDEIRRLVDEARAMGCREWVISGGEPMIRPDFPEIFDYITRHSVTYLLNTNGTLITPAIAALMKRPGVKRVAMYGATAEVYDRATRHPGGFEQMLRGLAYLKEAGARFTIQIVPMRANFEQWEDMKKLAESFTPEQRLGAAWLFLSADGSHRRNIEIAGQRLEPGDVVAIEPPETGDSASECGCGTTAGDDDRLFARCIETGWGFHVDPYGKMSFCAFIKDPTLRYDLRQGTFKEGWENFLPSLANRVRGGAEYRSRCGSCERRDDCRWCAAYAYLECGRYSAPVPYLCAIAKEAKVFKDDWERSHRRYFETGGLTVRVEADFKLDDVPIPAKFVPFQVEGPGSDTVTLSRHFSLPDLRRKNFGREVYRKPPWSIWRKDGAWIYLAVGPSADVRRPQRIAVFNADHTRGHIYGSPSDEKSIRRKGFGSLSGLTTDQIWLGPVLADRQACLLHAAGAILDRQGLAFVGHSEAGKSTLVRMLKGAGEILCDDRVIIRRWPDGFRLYGTWSHGDVPDVSGASAPLRGVLFLCQDRTNAIVPLEDKKDIWKRILSCLIRPLQTKLWWQKQLETLELLIAEVPFYTLRFDKSGAAVDELLSFVRNGVRRRPQPGERAKKSSIRKQPGRR